jgi:hypothetical protein
VAETATLPPPAEARDFAEYKRARKEGKDSASQPAVNETDSPADGVNSESGADGDELAAAESGSVSETGDDRQKQAKQQPQERTARGRISELSAKARAAEERAARLEQELEQLRKGTRSPEAPQGETPKTQGKPPAAQARTEEEPDLAALIDEAIREKGPDGKFVHTNYEQAQAKALKRFLQLQREAEAKKAEREREASEAKTAHEMRLAKTRERYSDFDEKIQAAIPQAEGIHNPGIEAAMAASETADLLYYFATHLDEFKKIAAMKPQAAYRETLKLDLKLASEQEDTPGAHAPMASRAPAPPPQAKGATSHSPKHPAGARDFAEYKRLRNAQSARYN